MKTRLIAVIIIALFLGSFWIVLSARAGYGTPSIDGVISPGEWGDPSFLGYDYSVYVLNDNSFLYVAFEADGGDFTIYPGMTNIYIYRGTDYAGECWAYSVLGSDGTPGLDHFIIHHIQPPKVKEGKESRPTVAEVAITTTVMEWKIPLNELYSPLCLGESIAFDFLSYSEGMSGWDTAWMYEQVYTLATLPSPVGGIWVPINKFELLAPYLGLASLITIATLSIVYVKYRKQKVLVK